MKAILCVTMLLLTCSFGFGQGISIGANAGGSYNNLNPDDPMVDNMSGIGFGGGLVVDVDVLPMLGIELDVLYSMYKYDFTVDDNGESFDGTLTYNNLVVPLLFKYKMAMPAVSPYFAVGPSLIKNLSGTLEATSGGVTDSDDLEDDELELDFGLQAGAGANIGMMPGMGISPYARFQYNLTGDLDWTSVAKESMWDILFGVNFTYKIM
jgi:hypothetical protein